MSAPKLRFPEFQTVPMKAVNFIDVLLEKTNGIKRGPFGGALKKESFVKDGFAVYE